jgi:hypothetical protein
VRKPWAYWVVSSESQTDRKACYNSPFSFGRNRALCGRDRCSRTKHHHAPKIAFLSPVPVSAIGTPHDAAARTPRRLGRRRPLTAAAKCCSLFSPSPAEEVVDAVALMPAEGLRRTERRTSAGTRPPSTSSCSGATTMRIRSSITARRDAHVHRGGVSGRGGQ